MEDANFNLVFIWSHPRSVEDAAVKRRGRKYKSERVGEYYHRIVEVEIYYNRDSDNIVADIIMRDGPELCNLRIPGASTSDSHTTFLHCIRSVHLLSDAYAYSTQQSKKTPKKMRNPVFTYEEHADAIARFTRSYINRLLPGEDLIPHPSTDPALIDTTPVDTQQGQEKSNGVSSSSKRTDRLKHSGSMSAIIRFLSTDQRPHTPINRFNPLKQPENDLRQPRRAVTILTLLLDQDDLANANFVFLEGLFTAADHEWIPHASMELNPIKRMIDIRNEHLLKIVIDHCMKYAKTRHPGYMEPVEQCMSDLLDRHPDMVADIFIKASYIPAHNQAYVASHAVDLNIISTTLGSIRSMAGIPRRVSRSGNKVFTLQSQLPIGGKSGRETCFSSKREQISMPKSRSSKIYVSPFQFKPIQLEERKESFLTYVSAKDLSLSPAVVASLRHKWYKYGRFFWAIRFTAVFVFFILVLAITVQQIRVPNVPSGQVPTTDKIAARYLPEWQPVFLAVIVIGSTLLVYEFLQMTYYPSKYFRSPFNWVDLAACLFPVAGCVIFLGATSEVGGDPSRIWPMGFGILALYLNM
ncbi:hypothetical protein BGX34_005105, partial [Mortierella sp. NVP85]